MSTYRELIYMVLDKIKETTDDSSFKEEHVAFLLDKYRPFLLKQRYSDIRKSISQNNYSVFKITLQNTIGSNTTIGYTYNYTVSGAIQQSTTLMPRLVSLNNEIEEFKVYNIGDSTAGNNQFKGDFSTVSLERFKYVGENKWLKNFVYVTIGTDYKLYTKNSTTLTLPTELLIQGVLENPKQEVSRILPSVTNYLDMIYPLEDALVPPLLELVTKDLSQGVYAPEDNVNNATDDLSKVATKPQTNNGRI